MFINDYSSIARGEMISKRFEFSPVKNINYNGQKLTQNITIKTKVDITKETEKLLRSNKLSDFKIGGYFSGVFKPDFYNEHPVLITKNDINYKIKKAKGKISPGLSNVFNQLVVSLSVVIFLAIMLRNKFELKELLYGAIGVLGIIFLIVYYFKLRPALSIGSITYKLKNIEGNFYQVNLVFEKRTRNIQKITYQLVAQERVTYDNGSSRSTTTHIFYESPLETIATKMSPITVEANFPKKALPGKKISGRSKIILGYEL